MGKEFTGEGNLLPAFQFLGCLLISLVFIVLRIYKYKQTSSEPPPCRDGDEEFSRQRRQHVQGR